MLQKQIHSPTALQSARELYQTYFIESNSFGSVLVCTKLCWCNKI